MADNSNDEEKKSEGEGKKGLSPDEVKALLNDNKTSLLSEIRAELAKKDEEEDVDEEEDNEDFSDEDFSDVREELSTLRLDKAEAKALLNLLSKKTGKLEGKIEKKMNKQDQWKQEKQVSEAEVAQLYPDILDKGSPLFKLTASMYENLPSDLKKTPYATKYAALNAASKLGIAPLDINAIKNRRYENPTGDNSESKKESGKKYVKQISSFAELFNVDKAKLEEIASRRIN